MAKAEWMIMQLESDDSPEGALFEIQLTGPEGRPLAKEGGRQILISTKSDTYLSDSEEEEPEDEPSIMALACGAAQTHQDAEAYAVEVLGEEEKHEGRSQSRLDIPAGLRARFITDKQMAAEQSRDPYCQQIIKGLQNDKSKEARHTSYVTACSADIQRHKTRSTEKTLLGRMFQPLFDRLS